MINPGMVTNMAVVRLRCFMNKGVNITPTQAPTFRLPPTRPISILLAFKMFRRTSLALEFQPSVTPNAKPPREANIQTKESLIYYLHYCKIALLN